MNARILLITKFDETHRQPLLESQGYLVQTARFEEVSEQLASQSYQLALIDTDAGISNALECCATLKKSFPHLRVALIAHRAEYIPASAAMDGLIRQQHSPRKFLAAVSKLVEEAGLNRQSFSASDGK